MDGMKRMRKILSNPIVQSSFLLILFYFLFEKVTYRFILGDVPSSAIRLGLTFTGFLIITFIITRLLYPDGKILSKASISRDDDILDVYFSSIFQTSKKSVTEEIAFRVIPYSMMYGLVHIFGYTPTVQSIYYSIAIIFTTAWVLMHKERFPIAIPSGVFFGILLVNGMIIESIIIHVIYNNALLTAGFAHWFVEERLGT